MLKALPRATLTKQAADTLRRFVFNESLQAGEQLPSERELSEVLSVSRNIVREALSILVSEGIIVKRPGRGIFVADFDRTLVNAQVAVTVDSSGHDLEAIREARAAIEIGAVDLMILNATASHIQQLIEINLALADSIRRNRSGVMEDVAFHTALLESTQNSMLIELTPLLVDYFRLNIFHNPSFILRNSERIIAEHQCIIEALQKRSSSETRRALINHLHLPIFALTD